MINKIVQFIFNSSFSEKKIKVKDIFFTDENENITRVINSIKKSTLTINKNSIIYDIGAFNGATAKLFSKAFPSTKIIGFEANPEVYNIALKNCEGNKNIYIHNAAISDKNETATFYVTSNNVSSSLNKINDKEVNVEDYTTKLDLKNKVSVEAKKLDEYNDNCQVLLMKIDTQGHELQVLKGLKRF